MGGPPRSFWRLAADVWLKEEGPQERRVLRDYIAARVPPGAAYRKGEYPRLRRALLESRLPPERDHMLSVESGANAIAYQAIRNALKCGSWYVTSDGRIAIADGLPMPSADEVDTTEIEVT